MAIGGTDSEIQTKLKNLYTSNLDPSILSNTPKNLSDMKGLVYKPSTTLIDWIDPQTGESTGTWGIGVPKNIQVPGQIDYQASGLTPDRIDTGDGPINTYRKSVSPYIDAVYSENGQLTGYEGNNNAYLTDNSYVHGSFDTSGKANPSYSTKSAGGFFQGQLPAMIALAAGAYGLSGVSDAVSGSFGGIDLGATAPNLGSLPTFGQGTQVADAGVVASPVTQGTVTATALPPLADVGTTAAGTVLGNAVTPAVAPSTTPLSGLGSGTLATPGDLGTQFVTGTPISTVGQGATLSAPTTATGALGAGLGGAATDAAGNIIPAIAGNAAGTAGAALASGLTPAADTSFLSSLIPSTPAGQIAAAQGLTGLGSALIGSSAAQKAADIQSAAAQSATALQGQIFNTINQQQTPYRTAGYNALNQLGGLGSGTYQMYDANGNPTTQGTGSGYLTHQFNAADLAAGLAPNYDFMLQQGQMANQRAANVGGGAIGGNALQGLNKYTQDYAGNAYQNAFQNYQQQRTGIYNTLAGIAGIGQQGQTATNTAGTNLANAQSSLGVGSAAAQAAGQVGTAGAYGNALGQLGSGLTLASLLNQRGNATLPIA